MTHVLQFALLGLGSGAVYALAAQGLVVAYRGSGVLNFSHGAVALLAAWVFTRTWADWGWPLWSSAVLGTATGVAAGGLIYCLVMRPLRKSAPLVRVIATLGVLACLQQLVIAVFGGDFKLVPKFISQRKLVVGAVSLSADRLILFGIAASVSLVLTVVFRYSRFGVSTRAVAESPVVASALGHSPHRISALNWMLSGGLAGVAGILIVQVSGLNIESTLLLVVPALAAALVAKFTSFSITFLAAVGIGIGQSLLVRYHNQPGWPDALPFVVIIVVLSLRGAAIPPRSEVAARLPKVGEGVLRPGLVAGMVAAGLLVLWTTPENWAAPLLSTCIVGIAALSLVVLTGYAGQISLGQYAFAGIGALVAGRLSQTLDLPFPLVFAAGTAAAALTGVLFA